MGVVVGLTGGIGSGKSVVASLFGERGAGIIDTDAIARQLTDRGGDAIPAIRETFGQQFIDAWGALDRAGMRRVVFAQPEAKRKLESILHPLIRKVVSAQMAQLHQPYGLLVVPLLIETGAYRDRTQRVLVVDCAETLQVTRTMARSGLTEAEVRAIMAEQVTRQARLSVADDVIENNGDIATLIPQVEKLHLYYLSLARQAIRPDA